MPSFGSSLSLLVAHLWLGVVAALLFVAGLATAAPVVRHDYRALMALPLWMVRKMLRFLGPGFRPLRVFSAIFTFNSVAIFLYMLSGVLIVVPAAVAFITGLHIGVVALKAPELHGEEVEGPPTAPALARRQRGSTPTWVGFCGSLVLLLELPSFWLAVGMGIGMARELSVPGRYTLKTLGALAAERIHAYWMVILPALFLSALAETAAIRGQLKAGGPAAGGHQGDNEPG